MNRSRNDMWALADEIDFSQRAINEITDDLAAAGRQRRARWPVKICISGGQTGADQGFLRAAKACGYQTGGMMPKGFLTEDGPRPDLAVEFGMTESAYPDYPRRTQWNVRAADGTLIFTIGDLDGGSEATAEYAKRRGSVYLHVQVFPGTTLRCIPSIDDVRLWIQSCDLRTINGAGNRESKSPGIGFAVERLCLEILRKP